MFNHLLCLNNRIKQYVLTVGSISSASGYYGDVGMGALSPNTYIVSPGLISRLYSDTSVDLYLTLSGYVAGQNHFSKLIVQSGDGTIRTFLTSDATCPYVSTWIWGDGSNRVYTSADNGEIKQISLVY